MRSPRSIDEIDIAEYSFAVTFGNTLNSATIRPLGLGCGKEK